MNDKQAMDCDGGATPDEGRADESQASAPSVDQLVSKGGSMMEGPVPEPGEIRTELDRALDEHVDDRIGSVPLEEYHRLTADDPFATLITPETVASFAERGLLHLLLTFKLPEYREVLDAPVFPCILVRPALEDIEAIEDLEKRADAILRLEIRATDERTRNLILSVTDSCWPGDIAQGNLLPREPTRKFYPWWYRPRQPYKRDLFEPNLFELFPENPSDDKG